MVMTEVYLPKRYHYKGKDIFAADPTPVLVASAVGEGLKKVKRKVRTDLVF